MRIKPLPFLTAAATIALFAPLAWAHPGHGGGFAAGVVHPVSGLDHVLAAVAVGLLAAQRGGRALWLLPLAFVALTAGGGLLAGTGIHLPAVEHGIAASVLVLGILVALAARLPLGATAAVIGLFAVFHGYAHISELPGGSPATFAAGAVVATAALHAATVVLGLTARRLPATGAWADRLIRAAGGGIAACGVVLLLNVA